MLKAPAQTGHDAQRHEFAAPLVHIFGEAVLEIRGAILIGIGDLRAEEEDQPQDIQPAHDQDHQREAAVNLLALIARDRSTKPS